MARKPSALARDLLRNFPKGRRRRGGRRRRRGDDGAGKASAEAKRASVAENGSNEEAESKAEPQAAPADSADEPAAV